MTDSIGINYPRSSEKVEIHAANPADKYAIGVQARFPMICYYGSQDIVDQLNIM